MIGGLLLDLYMPQNKILPYAHENNRKKICPKTTSAIYAINTDFEIEKRNCHFHLKTIRRQ